MTDLDKIADKKIKAQLTDLLEKPVEVEISGKIVEVYPLTVRQIDLALALEDADKKGEALKNLLVATLERCFPGHTREEYLDIPMNSAQKIFDAVMDVNNMKPEGGQKNVKGGFRQKQQ